MIQFAKRRPEFKDYRTKNSAVMTPDKGFVKQLKKLNKDYEVVWDWGAEKWEIWGIDLLNKPYHVTTVQAKGKTYRELGADVLLGLQKSIRRQDLSVDQICDYLDEMSNQERRRKNKDFRNKIEAITNETFDFARGVVKIQVPRCFNLERMVQIEAG